VRGDFKKVTLESIGEWMKMVVLLLFVLLAVIYAGPAEDYGAIHGFIFDQANHESVIGANIYMLDVRLGNTTNLSGYYIIPQVPPGVYTLVCEYIGYKQYKKEVEIKARERKRLDIFIEQEILEGEAITIVADSITMSEKLFHMPISKIELTPLDINRIPQVAEADLLRSLQTLPGILPISDFSSALYVRGGTPDQNLYMIDGADVYNPEHAFGIFSTFNTDAIKHVDFSKGGFTAEYGGRLSSIMDVTYLDGNQEEFEGTASVSLLSAKTTLQIPLGAAGALSGSFRRTYFDQTVARFIDNIPDYYFYDGNCKTFFNIDDNNKLTVSYYRGRDFLDIIFNEESGEDIGFGVDWGNSTGSIRWTSILIPNLFGNFWITLSRFSSYFNFKGGFDISEENEITDMTFKLNLEYNHSKYIATLFGLEQKNLHGIYEETFPGGLVDVDAHRTHYLGYVQERWTPSDRWEITSGLRYNYFISERNYQNWAPRFAAKYRLTESTTLKFASGRYYQYLHNVPRPFLTSIWTTSDQYQQASSADHYILGFQKGLGDHFSLEMEIYRKNFQNIYIVNQNIATDITPKDFTADGRTIYKDTQGLFLGGLGNSTGLEVFIKKDLGMITGWFGYTLAKTEHIFNRINQNQPFPPRHDRTSTINCVCDLSVYDIFDGLWGKPKYPRRSKFVLGLNFVYTTGQPITIPSSGYFTFPTPDYGDVFLLDPTAEGLFSIYPTRINTYRLPAYSRLDVSLTYTKYFNAWSIAPYLQVFNIGNRKNVWFIQYQDEGTDMIYNPEIETTNMLPFLPTFGVTINF
jgi:hypothetical protein